jgi:hypothetical protein
MDASLGLGFVAGIFAAIWAWPILTLAVFLCVMAFGLAYEREGWATGFVAVLVGGTVWAFWGQLDWATVALWTAGYAVIGLLMTYPLYNSYSRRKARAWKEHKAKFTLPYMANKHQSYEGFMLGWYREHLEKSLLDGIKLYGSNDWKKLDEIARPDERIKAEQAWEQYRLHTIAESWNYGHVILKVSRNPIGVWDVTHVKNLLVGQMILWFLYWPPYTLVMMLRDIVRNFFEWVVENIGGHFARMSTGHFNQV